MRPTDYGSVKAGHMRPTDNGSVKAGHVRPTDYQLVMVGHVRLRRSVTVGQLLRRTCKLTENTPPSVGQSG